MVKRILLIVLLAMGLSTSAWAQTALSQTRLNAAVTSVGQNVITLVSVTGAAVGDVVYVDREAMVVLSINTTAVTVNVQRGQLGTRAELHQNNQIVWFGAANRFYFNSPSGRCTAPQAYPGGFKPWINIITGEVWYCDDNLFGVNQPSTWRGTTLNPYESARIPYTAIAYRTSRTTDATPLVITPSYSVLVSDVLIASLTYSGPFEIFLPAPTGLLGKKITISDFARLAQGSPAGRTITIRGLMDTETSRTLGDYYADLGTAGITSTKIITGVGATTTLYVGMNAASTFYWMFGNIP